MAEKLIVELQDANGNIFYVQTSATAVFCADEKTVQEKIGTVKGRIATKDNLKLVTEANYLAEAKAVKDWFDELNSKSTQTVTQTINGLSCTFYLTKIGKLVICNIIASGSLSTNDQGVNSVIPATYRPAQSLFITAYNVTGTELSIDHGCTRYAFETTGRVTVTSNHKGVLERKAFGCWFTG